MGSSQVLAVTAMQSNCGDCKRASSCIGLGVSKENIAKAVNLTARKQLLHKADRLFSAGDQINNLYLVHSGVLKTYRITPEGDRQVIGFYFADQIINLDSLYDGKSTVFAEALNTASVCAVSIAEWVRSSDEQDDTPANGSHGLGRNLRCYTAYGADSLSYFQTLSYDGVFAIVF